MYPCHCAVRAELVEAQAALRQAQGERWVYLFWGLPNNPGYSKILLLLGSRNREEEVMLRYKTHFLSFVVCVIGGCLGLITASVEAADSAEIALC
jgi:hypothetical protein